MHVAKAKTVGDGAVRDWLVKTVEDGSAGSLYRVKTDIVEFGCSRWLKIFTATQSLKLDIQQNRPAEKSRWLEKSRKIGFSSIRLMFGFEVVGWSNASTARGATGLMTKREYR